jgi:hypothetical protein
MVDAPAIRDLTPWRAPAAEVLEAWGEAAVAFAAAGFELCVEWVDPWTDPEDGEDYDGFWHWFIRREELCSDGRVHGFMLDVGPVEPGWPQAIAHSIEFAQAAFAAHLAAARVTLAA